MDAKELEFEDGSFDAVFSLPSIEHFGTWADIRRSAREIGRVLRPGGAAFIATECFLGVGPEQVGSGDGRLSAER
jgi:ubiquinone/menaquinone biosynthesis C-methylase UbiE